MTIQAGPYRLGPCLLDHLGVSGGAFASLYEATGGDARPVVAKIARPRGGGRSGTEVWGASDDGRRLPVHIPAVARYLGVGEDQPVIDLLGPDLEQVLLAEAELLERDAGRLLPRSHGVWETYEDGRALPVLVMERLEGRQGPRSIEDVVAVLEGLAAGAGRGTLPFHGDLKMEHIFLEAGGRVRLCDPAPRLANPSIRAFTPLYNPRGHAGPAADAAACATILRHLLPVGDVAWRWCSELLDRAAPPGWADSHAAALAALRAELDAPSPPPSGWVAPAIPDRFGRREGDLPVVVAAPAESASDPTPGPTSGPTSDIASSDRGAPGSLASGVGDPRRVSTIRFQPVTPAGWHVKQSVTLRHPDGEANFIAATEPLSRHLDTDAYSESQVRLLRSEFPGFTEHSGGWLTLPSGHRAVWRTFSWTPPDGVRVTQLQMYVAVDGTGYTATGTATTTAWSRYEATFHELMRTIEVHDAAGGPTSPPPVVPHLPPPPPGPPPGDRVSFDDPPRVGDDVPVGDRVPVSSASGEPEPSGGVPTVFQRPRVTLADVAGLDDVKQHIDVRLMAPLRNPEMAARFGKTPSGGLLMWGPPGCGKTFLARALAGSLDIDFCAIGLDEVLDMWIGSSERNLAAVFEAARAHAPAALFFDEADALGGRRSRMGVHVVQRSLVSVLLTELDGAARDNSGVFTIAATNLPWDVDPALRRPGRFDRTLFVPPPDLGARSGILADRLAHVPIGSDLDLPRIALMTRGLSGADVSAVVDRAVDEAFTRSVAAGREVVVDQATLDRAAASASSSILDWIQTATTAAEASNDADLYEPFLRWLNRRDPGR